MNQSALKANTCRRRQARENACKQVAIGLVLLLIGSKSGASFFSQSQSEASRNYFRDSIENRSKRKPNTQKQRENVIAERSVIREGDGIVAFLIRIDQFIPLVGH